jgi:hypothetical protein
MERARKAKTRLQTQKQNLMRNKIKKTQKKQERNLRERSDSIQKNHQYRHNTTTEELKESEYASTESLHKSKQNYRL